MDEPLLSVIIVNYNVRDFLQQALTSVRSALKDIPAEILVVDNASHDGSVEMVRQQFPEVRLIANDRNLGFAHANNQALKQARGRFFALINPDTVVQEDTFRVLLDFFETHPDAGMVGCKILNPDGSLQLACRRSVPTPWVAFTKLVGLSSLFPRSRLFGRYNLTYLDPDQITEVEAISGSFMMVRREVVEQVGMLDERFFMYGEDLDWCYRIRQAGWKIYYVPTTQIVHYKGASSKKARLDTLLTFYRAMLQFARKHFRGRYLFLPQWFLMAGIAVRGGVSFLGSILRQLRWPLVDLLVLNLSLVLALLVRFGSLEHWRSYLPVTAIYSTVWLLSFYFFDLYEHKKFSATRAMGGVLLGLVVNSTITYFAKHFAFSRLVVLLAGGFNLLLIPGWRWALRLLARHTRWPVLDGLRRRYFRHRALLVGTPETVADLDRRLRESPLTDTQIVAWLLTGEDNGEKTASAPVKTLRDPQNLPWHVQDLDVNEVIFTARSLSFTNILSSISSLSASGVEFKIASDDLEVIIGSGSVEYLGEIPLVGVEYRFGHAPFRLAKRLLDLSVAVPATVLLAPLWLILLLAGYRFRRVPVYTPGTGKGHDLYDQNGLFARHSLVLLKKNKIPRTFWEKSPLVLGLLAGHLSLVGLPMAFEPFAATVQIGDLGLKPGLVGLDNLQPGAKVSAERLDRAVLFYLKNYSPWLDLEILMRKLKKR